jgi:Flp pilus assembly protein TadG
MPRTEKDTGAAAVEFALILPILVLLLCGIVDFGRAYNARITLSNAARESVRVWALGGTTEETTTAANDAAVGLTVTDVTPTGCTFGDPTTVTVTASFTFLTPLIADLSPGLSSLSTHGVMRCGG